MQPAKPLPTALLVIYNPGFKFKYKKYYIKEGSNIIGSNPNCQIVIQQGGLPQKAANIVFTDQLITLQPLVENAVHVLSNVKGKNNLMVPIGVGFKYVMQMQKDFVICGRKALMQVSDLNELLQIKGVVNEQMFEKQNIKRGDKSIQSNNNIKNQIKPLNVPVPQFEATLPLQPTYNFQPTMPLQQQYFQTTQKIQQNVEGDFEPTLPLQDNYDLIPQSYRNPSQKKSSTVQKNKQVPPGSIHSSSKKVQQPHSLHEPSFKQNHEPVVGQQQMQMPETIRQDSMPATIKQQDRNSNIRNVDSGQFPATIQQQDNRIMNQIKKKVNSISRSEPAHRQMKNSKVEISNFHSLDEKKNISSIDSFDDLFGNDEMHQSSKTVIMRSVHSKEEKSSTVMKNQIKQTHSQNGSNKTEKLLSDQDNQQPKMKKMDSNKMKKNLSNISQVLPQQQQSQKSKPIRCFVQGKINKGQKQKIKKKGLQLVENQEENFDILLIEGEVKMNKLLLISLIRGRQIKPLGWVSNPSAKIGGKLQGFLWDHIQKRKGKGKDIFKKHNTFYLEEGLRDQFYDVMVEAGANIMRELTRAASKSVIFIIIDEKSAAGRQLYEEKKNYKNWSFYGKKTIIESVLMGEQIIDKYRLNSYSF